MWTSALLTACLTITAQAPPKACAVQGKVTNAEGRPMSGAAVAIVPLGVSAVPDHQAVTDAKGGFRMQVPAGTYALTATHPEGDAYLPKVQVEGKVATLDPVVLKTGGYLLEGKVSLPKGAKGVRFALARVSQDDGDMFPVALHHGAFSLRLREGSYSLFAKGGGVRSPRSITVNGDQRSLAVVLEAEPKAASKPVKEWIRGHAIPLRTVEAGHGFEDMRPLAKVVGKARVVSLGEATHGTREFFQMKHRMLEFLVSEMGFTAFAIEANLPECKALNDYVLEGKGDPKKGLDGIYFWTWNTQEVLAMVEWLRQWNADPAHTRKVRFYGFDNQTAQVAYRWVKARLDAEDPELGSWMGKELSALGEAGGPKLEPSKLKTLREAAAELGRRLDAKPGFDVFLRRCARILEQKLDIDLEPGGGVARDVGMAENVRWILDQEGPEGRVVVWAHNGHVQTGNDLGGHAWMGGHLRKALGKDMVVFGFAFREGSFQAIDWGPTKAGLRDFAVKAMPTATLDAALKSTGFPMLALDLRTLPAAGPVRAWFEGPQGSFDTGAVFTEGRESAAISQIHVLEAYDGLIFVAHTTAAKPNHPRGSGTPKVSGASAVLPSNLGFEEGPKESPFTGWFSNPGMKEYTAKIIEESAHEGRRWLQIRHSGEANSSAWGTVMQSLQATPYRGKKVRLTGWLKASEGSRATWWLRVDRPGGSPGFFDNAMNRSVSQNLWTQLVIDGSVADDAVSLNFGAMILGDGAAGFDDLKIEVLN